MPQDARAQVKSFEDVVGSFEITFDDVGDSHGWNNVHPRGEKPVPRQFVSSCPSSTSSSTILSCSRWEFSCINIFSDHYSPILVVLAANW